VVVHDEIKLSFRLLKVLQRLTSVKLEDASIKSLLSGIQEARILVETVQMHKQQWHSSHNSHSSTFTKISGYQRACHPRLMMIFSGDIFLKSDQELLD
jgi:hypothetical protein